MRFRLSTLLVPLVVALLAATVGHPRMSSAGATQSAMTSLSYAMPGLPPPDTSDANAPGAVVDVAAPDIAPLLAQADLELPEASYPFASAACGTAYAAGDFIATLDGRSYRLHVPASYNPVVPTPLVVNFSGYDRTAVEQEQYSGLVPIADRQGFILVTPEGSGSPEGWNIVGVYNEDGVDDVAFTSALVQQIKHEFCVDDARIYAIGISNGAEMASQVACDLPQTFAAVAAIAGVIDQGCTTSVPVVAFHGTADENVPFEWAPAAVQDWATTNGCFPAGTSTAVSAHVDLVDYGGCTADAEVAFYIIDGGGHTWPGAADDAGGGGPTTHEISASEIAWQFFAAHPQAR